jgi:peroxiredoxin
MKKTALKLMIISLMISPWIALADVTIGKPAPDFTLVDSNGKSHTLKNFKGKTVVLEWLNFECPFVKKYYESGAMQKIQADETAKGVVWLSVISSAKGKQGYYEPTALNARNEKEKGKATAILLDTDGKIGKLYGAQTTPHMFVIDQKGALVYRGAIDDQPSTDREDLAKAKNYVKAALDDLRAGRKVASSETKSYGCGVKY